MNIRIGTKAWAGSAAVDSREEARGAIGPQWVEIDGTRYDSVISAKVEIDGDTLVTVQFAATVEMVLLDSAGQIIPSVEIDASPAGAA
jgi:hypothetical protein